MTNYPSGKKAYILPNIMIHVVSDWIDGGLPSTELSWLNISPEEARDSINILFARDFIHPFVEIIPSGKIVQANSLPFFDIISGKLQNVLTERGQDVIENSKLDFSGWLERWERYCQK